jgi:hypothetical protein
MCGVVSPIPHTSSWRDAQSHEEQLNFTLPVYANTSQERSSSYILLLSHGVLRVHIIKCVVLLSSKRHYINCKETFIPVRCN